MTQNGNRPNVELAITPSESPVLVAGQRVEMSVRLRNDGTQLLQASLSIGGEFPADWFTPDDPWLQDSDRQFATRFTSLPFDIAPQAILYKTLSFTLPSDFFERAEALAHRPALLYPGTVSLYRTESAQLVGHSTFKLQTQPSRTYIDFLPEIYQESDFLGRFLSITEQALEPAYEALETFWAYLDPLTAPKALIPFLAHWVAWPMNPRWTLSQQRRLIRHAIEIYQWRGTKRGLQWCLHLCTGLPLDDDHIHIDEAEDAGFILGQATLSEEPCLGGGQAYHFVVTLRPEADQAESLEESMVREIIEQEKPAFCTYDLVIEPGR
ncbi:MAG: phage tail protein [Cyanobacteria bacterium P01_H01_bin.26]